MKLELYNSDGLFCFVDRLEFPSPCFGFVIDSDIVGNSKYYVEGGYLEEYNNKIFSI